MKTNKNSLIENVTNGTLSNRWKNKKGGSFKFFMRDLNTAHFRFAETDYPNCNKYLSADPSTFPIVACGLIAFLIRNWYRKNINLLMEYYGGLFEEYKKKEERRPDAWKRNLILEFYANHIAEETLKVERSQIIFDYLTKRDKVLINKYVNAYLNALTY
jgi:hypothetical protein